MYVQLKHVQIGSQIGVSESDTHELTFIYVCPAKTCTY